MEKKLFKNNLSAGNFYLEVTKDFYRETQEGFDLLADEFNSRINPRFGVSILWIRDTRILKIVINYSGSDSSARMYSCCFFHSTIYSDIARIEDILTAFACGLGFEC